MSYIITIKTDRLWRDSVLDVPWELASIRILVVLLQLRHVLRYVLTKDVSTMNVRMELLALAVVARESLRPNSNINKNKWPSMPRCWNVRLRQYSIHVTLFTVDLWPWKPYQQFPLTWWIFVASFIDIPPLSRDIMIDWVRPSHQTLYRSYQGQVFTDQMTQPTVSKHWRNIQN